MDESKFQNMEPRKTKDGNNNNSNNKNAEITVLAQDSTNNYARICNNHSLAPYDKNPRPRIIKFPIGMRHNS